MSERGLCFGDVVLRAKHSPMLFTGVKDTQDLRGFRYHFRCLETGKPMAYRRGFFWIAFDRNGWQLLQRSHPDALW